MYKETNKEKILRFAIIAGIAMVTMYLFTIVFNPDPIEESETGSEKRQVEQMAVAIEELDDQQEFPIIVMVKEHEEQPILIKYKINPEDNYRFETLHATELHEVPSALEKDMLLDGVWLNLDGSWTYFNNELEMGKHAKKASIENTSDFFVLVEETDTNQYILKISNDSGLIIQKTFGEKPISTVRLSSNNDLWLVLFQKDTILLIP